MIVPDVNLLLLAMNRSSAHHPRAWEWWHSVMRGSEHIGFSWHVLIGYVRMATDPRIVAMPFSVADAVADTESWIALPRAHVLLPRGEHLLMVERMLEPVGRGGKLVPHAHLAALALQHGGTVYSRDGDFGRFPHVPWVDPLV